MNENTRERLKEITDSIEQGIQDLFESDKYMKYLRTMSRFHHYSFNNTLLIAMQRPDATLVAGFKKWRDQFGRNVMRGEKAIRILAPTPFKKKIEKERVDPLTNMPLMDADGNVLTEEVVIKIPMFKVVSVFDVLQTEGKPLPQLASDLTGDVQQYDIFMEALRRSSPVPIAFEDMEPETDGYFSRSRQRIAIRTGMSEIQTVSAVIHEIAHSKLHNHEKERLAAVQADENAEPPKPKNRRTEEVEAESVSFAVCAYYGIQTDENSFGYIAAWSRDKELPELRASLETIDKTASELIDDVDRHFAEIVKERDIDLTAQEAGKITAAELAADIDAFSYDYDPYGYHDAVDDREAAVAELAANIERGDASYIRDWLLSIVNENDEYSPRARCILDQYESFMLRTQERENSFLNNPADAFAIYQLKDTDELRDIRFEPMSWLQSLGRSVEHDNYNIVYTAPLTGSGNTTEWLDALWYQFNNEHPADFRGHSLSVSDIVALKQNGVVSCHYVDSFGFQELPGFISITNNVHRSSHAESMEKCKSVLERLATQYVKPEYYRTAPIHSAEMER